jgi:hypothetical protein
MTSVTEPEKTAGTDPSYRRGPPPPIEATPTGTLPSGTANPPVNPGTATSAMCPTQTDVAVIAKTNQ